MFQISFIKYKGEITNKTLKYSIAGGNQEIINILKEKDNILKNV